MPQIPREPRPGERPDSTTLIQLIRYVRDLARQLATLQRMAARPSRASSVVRTLFVTDASTEAGAAVAVSVGRIANLPLTIGGAELGATPAPVLPIASSGVIYIVADFDDGGDPADDPQGFEILAGASVPANTETAAHKVLAEVTVAGGAITALNPVAWNFSEIQRCGATTYLWGGFGGD